MRKPSDSACIVQHMEKLAACAPEVQLVSNWKLNLRAFCSFFAMHQCVGPKLLVWTEDLRFVAT